MAKVALDEITKLVNAMATSAVVKHAVLVAATAVPHLKPLRTPKCIDLAQTRLTSSLQQYLPSRPPNLVTEQSSKI